MRAIELFEEQGPQPLFSEQEELSYEELAPLVAEFVMKNCRPYLNEIRSPDNILYRGVHGVTEPVFTKVPRSNRKPKDSNEARHKAFNAIITALGGTDAANRSNSVFATSSIYDAKQYGLEYVIMPIGNFRYTWSDQHVDWAVELHPESYLTKRAKFYTSIMPLNKIFTNVKSYDIEALEEFLHLDQHLSAAIASKHEVMIKASNILYIDPDLYKHVLAILK